MHVITFVDPEEKELYSCVALLLKCSYELSTSIYHMVIFLKIELWLYIQLDVK